MFNKSQQKMLESFEIHKNFLAKSGYKYHHTASAKGYLSRRPFYGDSVEVRPYKGRFGQGYTLEYPRWDTNNYHYKAYFVKDGEIK